MLSKEEIEKIKKGIESATSIEELEDLDSVIDDLLTHTDIKVEEKLLPPVPPKPLLVRSTNAPLGLGLTPDKEKDLRTLLEAMRLILD